MLEKLGHGKAERVTSLAKAIGSIRRLQRTSIFGAFGLTPFHNSFYYEEFTGEKYTKHLQADDLL